MKLSTPSVTHHLSIGEVITALTASPLVDGIAEFGSRSTGQSSPSSDYDLLILVKGVPARVFQMITSVDGQLADIVLVETETADALLATQEPPQSRSFDALFAQKMQTAHILYDASERLHRVKQLVMSELWLRSHTEHQTRTSLSTIWFWQSFGLLHLERMIFSADPIRLSAADMMLTACLADTWRSYFGIREIAWEGEKAAIRYWEKHDRDYLFTVRHCLDVCDRKERLTRYRKLVEQTLEPIGTVFTRGETAVLLANSADNSGKIREALNYWNSLVVS